MADLGRQAVALMAVVLVLGSGAFYYAYASNARLEQENAGLSSQVSTLQQANAALESQVSRFQGNLTRLYGMIDLLKIQLAHLQGTRVGGPLILLRTWGAGLASYVIRSDGVAYLRLIERGGTSGVEAAFASHPFNATLSGNSIEWTAVANSVAADKNHTFWPMVLENSPAGTNAIEFEQAGGVQEVATDANGARSTAIVHWNATEVHAFKIVIVTPGAKVDFYIDGVRVGTITTNVPDVRFLLEAAEVKGSLTGTGPAPVSSGVATLDAYGGLLGGS